MAEKKKSCGCGCLPKNQKEVKATGPTKTASKGQKRGTKKTK